jgi:DNA-binding beta-propeller fold protein YncE
MIRPQFLILPVFLCSLAAGSPVWAGPAEDAYRQGMALQQAHKTEDAIKAYKKALSLKPGLGPAHYELGWSYWVQGDWARVVRHWREASRLKAGPPELARYLREAQDNLDGRLEPLVRVPIGAVSAPSPDAPSTGPTLELIARFQHYNPRPANTSDHFDPFVFSPKSVRFLEDGSKVYVNALEGFTTVVYDPRHLRRIDTIVHHFDQNDAGLFDSRHGGSPWLRFPDSGVPADPNQFSGKPVESALSIDGHYLWVPYYRRDYDRLSKMPSAVAIIDVRTDRIVRVMSTGPIPKYVVASPDGHWMAVVHWGDNTVGLIDTLNKKPSSYRRAALITVGRQFNLNTINDADRDHGCGFCLRGAVFTPDSRYLLVARMGGGGIAVIDVRRRRYVDTVFGMRPTPRHLELSPDGHTLFVSSNFAGYVSRYRIEDLVHAARRHVRKLKPEREIYTGESTRTIAVAPNGRWIFAAANKESQVVVLDAGTLKPLARVAADSYPVGLAVSPDNTQLWVTSQGRDLRGGNSVMVYRIGNGSSADPLRRASLQTAP